MCIPIHQCSRKDRALRALANFALFAGIALVYAVHSSGTIEKNWLEALRGFLIGLSIGINLLMIRLGRRSGRTTAENV
jgi:hypothetical protein